MDIISKINEEVSEYYDFETKKSKSLEYVVKLLNSSTFFEYQNQLIDRYFDISKSITKSKIYFKKVVNREL